MFLKDVSTSTYKSLMFLIPDFYWIVQTRSIVSAMYIFYDEGYSNVLLQIKMIYFEVIYKRTFICLG